MGKISRIVVFITLLAETFTFAQSGQKNFYSIKKIFIDEVKTFEISRGDTITRFYDAEKMNGGYNRKVITYTGTYNFFTRISTGDLEISREDKLIIVIPKGDKLTLDGISYHLDKNIEKGSTQRLYTYLENEKEVVSFKFYKEGKSRVLEINQLQPFPASHQEIMDLYIQYLAMREVFHQSNLPGIIAVMVVGLALKFVAI
ncbi:MAG: hypothetical protein ABJH04_11725 [Cyclobacteriaceae bacterium]